MSLHNKPEWHTPNLDQALREHNLPVNEPSQLSDAFRCGWMASQKVNATKEGGQ